MTWCMPKKAISKIEWAYYMTVDCRLSDCFARSLDLGCRAGGYSWLSALAGNGVCGGPTLMPYGEGELSLVQTVPRSWSFQGPPPPPSNLACSAPVCVYFLRARVCVPCQHPGSPASSKHCRFQRFPEPVAGCVYSVCDLPVSFDLPHPRKRAVSKKATGWLLFSLRAALPAGWIGEG